MHFRLGPPGGPSPAVMPILSTQGEEGGPGPEPGGRSGPRRSAVSCRQHLVPVKASVARTVHQWSGGTDGPENRGRNQEFSTLSLASWAFVEGF